MTVQLELTREQEARLAEAAARNGVSLEALLAEAAQYVVLTEEQEDAILARRLEDADRGDFLTREEMDARVRAMLQH